MGGKGSNEMHKKTKAAIVYRPQNSTQPIPRKKPETRRSLTADVETEKKEVGRNLEQMAERPVLQNASGEDTGREKVRNEAEKKEMEMLLL